MKPETQKKKNLGAIDLFLERRLDISCKLAFLLFASVAILSAYYNNIWDCDESMNYFEPLHKVIYGYGLQTWEYSPAYGLRSYFYISLHAALSIFPASIFKIQEFLGLERYTVSITKMTVFYSIRLCLGLIGALSQTYLFYAIKRKIGNFCALFFTLFVCLSPGNFNSITSFLPSTFAMYCYTGVLAAILLDHLVVAEHLVALSAIIGWPFSILVGLPTAIIILLNRGIWFAIFHGILSLIFFLIPSVVVDFFFYKKIVVASANIVLYNVFGHAGPELYGIEPWYYYLINGLLNFNIILLLSILTIPLLIIYMLLSKEKSKFVFGIILKISGGYLWIIYMSIVPHKEERFLFVVYPFICFAASLTTTTVVYILLQLPALFKGASWMRKFTRTLIIAFIVLVFLVSASLSISRVVSLGKNYSAPMTLYSYLYELETKEKQISGWTDVFSVPATSQVSNNTLCLGKEWYRFPTHFFLPSTMRIGFIQDGFGGQLPQYYGDGTDSFSRSPAHFNDLNKEEITRYIPVETCSYLITFMETDESLNNFSATNGTDWDLIQDLPFLNAKFSHPIFRAFYVPHLSERKNVFGHYVLFKRRMR